MTSLSFVLLMCYVMLHNTYAEKKEKKDRKGNKLKIGRNALPNKNKDEDKFDGFQDFNEAETWVKEQYERMFLEESHTDPNTFVKEFDDMFGEVVDENTIFVIDGRSFRGKTRFEARRITIMPLIHLVQADEDVTFIDNEDNWSEYYVKFSYGVSDSRRPTEHHMVTIQIEFRKNGKVDKFYCDIDDHIIGQLLDQAAAAAFTVTDVIGEIAESVGMKDVYLKYVVYIFLVVLVGMTAIVLLLTGLCIKIVCLDKNKNKYKNVPATDNEL